MYHQTVNASRVGNNEVEITSYSQVYRLRRLFSGLNCENNKCRSIIYYALNLIQCLQKGAPCGCEFDVKGFRIEDAAVCVDPYN